MEIFKLPIHDASAVSTQRNLRLQLWFENCDGHPISLACRPTKRHLRPHINPEIKKCPKMASSFTDRSFIHDSENETSFQVRGGGGGHHPSPLYGHRLALIEKCNVATNVFSLLAPPSLPLLHPKRADDESDSENVFPAKNSPCSSRLPPLPHPNTWGRTLPSAARSQKSLKKIRLHRFLFPIPPFAISFLFQSLPPFFYSYIYFKEP